MFSLQRIIGRDDEFCALLETSAQLAVDSVRVLKESLNSPQAPSLERFVAAQRANKEITARISNLLATVLVTSLEREDVEHLAETFYKIPKTVEKFAERYRISFELVHGFDFQRQVALLEEATAIVLAMVRSFRARGRLLEIIRLNDRLQLVENQADAIALQLMESLYAPDFPSLTGIVVKDLVELNEKVVDRCHEAGQALARVTIKTC